LRERLYSHGYLPAQWRFPAARGARLPALDRMRQGATIFAAAPIASGEGKRYLARSRPPLGRARWGVAKW